ncbi:MAG: hypothetical protein PHO28_02695 [Candidatus Pacebacteria bacterium]|nr:hypothetical protein [Candidatus Paceibacterota bacterium]
MKGKRNVLLRIHSGCITADIFYSKNAIAVYN